MWYGLLPWSSCPVDRADINGLTDRCDLDTIVLLFSSLNQLCSSSKKSEIVHPWWKWYCPNNTREMLLGIVHFLPRCVRLCSAWWWWLQKEIVFVYQGDATSPTSVNKPPCEAALQYHSIDCNNSGLSFSARIASCRHHRQIDGFSCSGSMHGVYMLCGSSVPTLRCGGGTGCVHVNVLWFVACWVCVIARTETYRAARVSDYTGRRAESSLWPASVDLRLMGLPDYLCPGIQNPFSVSEDLLLLCLEIIYWLLDVSRRLRCFFCDLALMWSIALSQCLNCVI